MLFTNRLYIGDGEKKKILHFGFSSGPLVSDGYTHLDCEMCVHMPKFSRFEHFKHGQGILC